MHAARPAAGAELANVFGWRDDDGCWQREHGQN
jgi:hypothetical protein